MKQFSLYSFVHCVNQRIGVGLVLVFLSCRLSSAAAVTWDGAFSAPAVSSNSSRRSTPRMVERDSDLPTVEYKIDDPEDPSDLGNYSTSYLVRDTTDKEGAAEVDDTGNFRAYDMSTGTITRRCKTDTNGTDGKNAGSDWTEIQKAPR
jgi:hypothetical protein